MSDEPDPEYDKFNDGYRITFTGNDGGWGLTREPVSDPTPDPEARWDALGVDAERQSWVGGTLCKVPAADVLALLAERACLLAIKDAAEEIEPFASEWLRLAEFEVGGARFATDRRALYRFRAALSALPEDQTP